MPMDAESPVPIPAAAAPAPPPPPPSPGPKVDGRSLRALALASGHGAPLVDETRAGASSPPPALGRAGRMPCVVVNLATLLSMSRQGLVRKVSGTQAWEPTERGLQALRAAPAESRGGPRRGARA